MSGQVLGNDYGLLQYINDFFLRDWLRRNLIPSHSAPTSPLFYCTPGPQPTDFNDSTVDVELIDRRGAMAIWRINGMHGHLLFISPPPVPPGPYEFDVHDWLVLPFGGDTDTGGGLPNTDGTQTQYWTWDNFNIQPGDVPMYLCYMTQNSAFPVGEVSSISYDHVVAVFNAVDPYDATSVWSEALMEYQPDEVAWRVEGIPVISDQAGMKGDRTL